MKLYYTISAVLLAAALAACAHEDQRRGTTASSSPPTSGEAPAGSTVGGTTSTTNATTTSAPGYATTGTQAERTSGSMTPVSQGTSQAEIDTTSQIRRSLMSDHSLSFQAKNVNIITVGTTVTLQGTVSTDAERQTIESIAKQTGGVSRVEDQIEVKR